MSKGYGFKLSPGSGVHDSLSLLNLQNALRFERSREGLRFPPNKLASRFRTKRGPFERFQGLLPESQGHDLALTVLYVPDSLVSRSRTNLSRVQVYLAHKKQPPPLGPPSGPGHIPTAGSQGGDVSYERGTPCSVIN